MAGMYPDNKNLEFFGETVSWPGVDENGKFTNGNFTDPAARPSFIPAETINLILDNLSELIIALGKTPNNQTPNQLASAVLAAINAEATERTTAVQTLHTAILAVSPEIENNVQAVLNLLEEIRLSITAHKAAATLDHPNASITAAKLAANAVETAKIKDAAVTAAKLAEGAVTFAKVAAAAKSTTTPKVNGAAAVGTESAFARGDHVHPTDTTRAALASPTFSGTPMIGTNPVAVAASTSTLNDASLPIGAYIIARFLTSNNRDPIPSFNLNSSATPRCGGQFINALMVNVCNLTYDLNQVQGTALAGAWKVCGNTTDESVLLRRVA